MEDIKIIELYWNKKENAIYETDKKYGKYKVKIYFKSSFYIGNSYNKV